MKKKVLIGTILPVLATVAVIGSGYSIFYLGNQTAEASNDMSADITQLVGAGEITKASDFSIIFDQTKESRDALLSNSTIDSINGSDETALGVNLYWASADATKVVTYTHPNDGTIDHIDSYDVYDHDATSKGTVSYTFEVKFTLGKELAAYVDMNYTAADGATSWTKGTDDAENGVYTFTTSDNGADDIFDLSDASLKLSYKEGKEPTTVAEYNALKTIVNSTSGLKAEYKVTVKANIND